MIRKKFFNREYKQIKFLNPWFRIRLIFFFCFFLFFLFYPLFQQQQQQLFAQIDEAIYHLDGNFNDATTNGRHLELTGQFPSFFTWDVGKFHNGGTIIRGGGAQVALRNQSTKPLSSLSQTTFGLWVNTPTNWSLRDNNRPQYVLSLCQNLSESLCVKASLLAQRSGLYLIQKSPGDVRVGCDIFTDHKVAVTTPWTLDNQWHHAACRYDGTSVSLFVDGILKTTAPHASIIPQTSWYGVNFGSAQANRAYGFDDLFIRSEALSDAAITTIATSGKPYGPPLPDIPPPAKIDEAIYHLDGNFNDATTNGRHLELTGQFPSFFTWDVGKFHNGGTIIRGGGAQVALRNQSTKPLSSLSQTTFGLWVNTPTNWSLRDNNRPQYVLSLCQNLSESLCVKASLLAQRSGLYLIQKSPGDVRVGCDIFTDHKVAVTTPWTLDNQWHHAACRYDGTSVSLFVDGILKTTAPHASIIPQTSWYGVNFGSAQANRAYGFDDLFIRSEALEDEQINFIFTSDEPYTGEFIPPVTTIDVAVILAEPSGGRNFDPSHDAAHFTSNVFPDVKDYWCEVSFGARDESDVCIDGLVDLQFQVFDNGGQLYQLPNDWAFYSENHDPRIDLDFNGDSVTDFEDQRDRTIQFGYDALVAAIQDITPLPDFAVVVFPGERESALVFPFDPLRLRDFAFKFDPAPIPRWITVSENDKVLEWAHEMGHHIGDVQFKAHLCDLYTTVGGCEDGGSIGNWGLMGGTDLSKLFRADPAHLSSYSQIKLGWLGEDPIVFGPHTLESLSTMNEGDLVKRFDAGSGVYFLLEARSTDPLYSDWDTNAPQSGAVVYRVEPRQVTVDGQPTTITFVDVVAELGTAGLLPYRNPVDDLIVDVTSTRDLPDRFEVDVDVTDESLTNYVGALMRPGLDLLGRLWSFGGPERLNAVYAQSDSGEFGPNWVRGDPEYWIYGLRTLLYKSFGVAALLTVIVFGVVISRLGTRKRKVLGVVALVIVLVLLALIFFLFFPLSLNASTVAREVPHPRIYAAALDDGNIAPDLDLHAFSPSGLHVGMNYEIGEYEIQIPSAIASGDLWGGEEWIFVPEGTQVKFLVFAKDTQQFFQENPDIAAQLPDTSDSYDIFARFFDTTSNSFDSAVISNQIINPGEVIVHQTQGTVDISISPGIVDAIPPTTTISLSDTIRTK
ncbi:hypothetical protein MYX07_00645 [Patescibacteria group bacterium AH-259-L07]|nr:hypothetical protein [Patescibacteria group bacterium AH-259-L07]